jgi:hypothetical protein
VSWVRAFVPANRPFPSPGVTPTGSDDDQKLRQSVSRITVSEAGNRATQGSPCRTLQYVRVIDRNDCLVCQGGSFLALVRDPINPDPTIVSPGRAVISGVGQIDPNVLAALQDASRSLVLASDIRAWSTGRVRGVVLAPDRSIQSFLGTGANGELVETDPPSTPALAAARTAARAAPAPQRPFLVVLSGHRHDVAFVERDPAGAVLQQLRTFDFDLGYEVVKPFLGNHRLVDPIAMTYRAEDDAYYLLDRTRSHHPSVTLYRLPRGNTLELVGTWRRPGNLREAALTTGTDGTLVLTTWNDKRHAIAVLDLGSGDIDATSAIPTCGASAS